jgi:hypothetical protein
MPHRAYSLACGARRSDHARTEVIFGSGHSMASRLVAKRRSGTVRRREALEGRRVIAQGICNRPTFSPVYLF